jgi:hypothetical protein
MSPKLIISNFADNTLNNSESFCEDFLSISARFVKLANLSNFFCGYPIPALFGFIDFYFIPKDFHAKWVNRYLLERKYT